MYERKWLKIAKFLAIYFLIVFNKFRLIISYIYIYMCVCVCVCVCE